VQARAKQRSAAGGGEVEVADVRGEASPEMSTGKSGCGRGHRRVEEGRCNHQRRRAGATSVPAPAGADGGGSPAPTQI
jgi:hypothetical protein